MTYIEIINAFERWVETNYLPAQSQLLWYKFLALFNRCGWAEWVTVDNQKLMALIQVRREATFIELRNNLIEKDLLEYQKGKKGSPNRYKLLICTFTGEVNTVVNRVVQTEVYTEAQTVDINRLRLDKENTPISPCKNDMTALFEIFWKSYPRKVAKSNALKAWKKHKPDEALLSSLLKALDMQKQSDNWQKDNGQYIPYPATWLNGRRWEDEEPSKPDSPAENVLSLGDIAHVKELPSRTLDEIENLKLEELI